MEIGCLGSTVFNVSADCIKTLTKFTRSGSVSVQKHSRHMQKELPEFVGIDLESISFNIQLSTYLGVSPKDEERALYSQMYKGAVLPFTLGDTYYGLFLITKLKSTGEHTDGAGNYQTINMSVTLTEYV